MTFVAWVVDRFEVDVQTIQAAKLVPAFEVLPEPRYSVEAVPRAPRESRQAA